MRISVNKEARDGNYRGNPRAGTGDCAQADGPAVSSGEATWGATVYGFGGCSDLDWGCRYARTTRARTRGPWGAWLRLSAMWPARTTKRRAGASRADPPWRGEIHRTGILLPALSPG